MALARGVDFTPWRSTAGLTGNPVLDLQPRLWGFLLGFVVTALFWIGHYRTFSCVERVNGVLIGLDLAFLLAGRVRRLRAGGGSIA